MEKSIYNVYVEMQSQEQCDRMKQLCVDNNLDFYDNFNFEYLRKLYKYFYCSAGYFCNWLELEYNVEFHKVTETEFIELLKQHKNA